MSQETWKIEKYLQNMHLNIPAIRVQTRISHVHPTASIHQPECGTRLRLCYCGVLRAGAPPAMLWRTRVPVTWGVRPPWSDGWELLGRLGDRGGASRRRTGPKPAEGRSRRTGGGSGPTTSIRNAGGAFTYRMTAETLRVLADIACVTYTCIYTVTTARMWY